MRRELGLGVNAFLRLTGMSKGTYYRRRRQAQAPSPPRPRPKRKAIRGPAREIALAFPAYGYRKVWAELLRRGIPASPSTVYRVLKEEGLLLPVKRRRRKDQDKRSGSEPPRPERVGLVLSAGGALWRLVEHKGASSLGGYRILNVIKRDRGGELPPSGQRGGEGRGRRDRQAGQGSARASPGGGQEAWTPYSRAAASHRPGLGVSGRRPFAAIFRSTRSGRPLPRWGGPRAWARSSDCIGA